MIPMKPPLRKQAFLLLKSLQKECGQDLVEYALLVSLIAFGATAGMRSIASKVNETFTNIGLTMTSAT